MMYHGYQPVDAQEGSEPPTRYCQTHGILLKAVAETEFDYHTGKMVVRRFRLTCPKFFCFHMSEVRVIGPRPNPPRGVPKWMGK